MTYAETNLDVHRTMVAVIAAYRAGSPDRAQFIMNSTLTTPEERTAFVSALIGFALGMLTSSEGMATAFGGHFDSDAYLSMYSERLATMTDLAGVEYGGE